MDSIDNYLLGRNIKLLRKSIGISQHDLSTLLDISKRTLAGIESGNSTGSFKILNQLSEFFNLGIGSIISENLQIPENFRNKLTYFHKSSSHFLSLLKKKPNLGYAIQFVLLNSEFFDKPREINEIKNFFEKEGWRFLGPSISNALKKQEKWIIIEQHAHKRNTNVYRRKINVV